MQHASEAIDIALAVLRRKSEPGRDFYYGSSLDELKRLASWNWPTSYDKGKFVISYDKYDPPEEAGDNFTVTISWEFGTFSKYRVILAHCWLGRTLLDAKCDALRWTALTRSWVSSEHSGDSVRQSGS